jgi:UDP-N-acetylmuramate dehydrogenase
MQIRENISLKPYNTFGIDAKARFFSAFKSMEELSEILCSGPAASQPGLSQAFRKNPLILGGGSNILLTGDYDGLVLKNELPGIQKIKEDDEFVYVKSGAGENWHRFVLHCIENGWAGVENLSLIPGNVGASPMQNIGAYGVEIRDVFHELKAFHLHEKTNYHFGVKDCEFGYRDSVFKKKYRNQFVIIHVIFKLRKNPVFNTSYGAIEKELQEMNVQQLSIKAISDAVIRIRTSKLPDPAQIGNAGSFFKNPVIDATHFKKLQSEFPAIVGHENNDGTVKLAAGWLIENSGPDENQSWKGFRRGDAGCHDRQALVLVNYGNASGQEIFKLSEDIHATVLAKFGVSLEREVNII